MGDHHGAKRLMLTKLMEDRVGEKWEVLIGILDLREEKRTIRTTPGYYFIQFSSSTIDLRND